MREGVEGWQGPQPEGVVAWRGRFPWPPRALGLHRQQGELPDVGKIVLATECKVDWVEQDES